MDPDPTTRERTLLDSVAAGDQRALAELAGRHRDELLAQVRKLTESDAEDVLELALASAYVAIHGGARPEPVGPWLAAIARDAAQAERTARRSTPAEADGGGDAGSLRVAAQRARRRLGAVTELAPSPALLWRSGVAIGVVAVATAVIAASVPDRGDGDRDRVTAQAEERILVPPPAKPVSRSARSEAGAKEAANAGRKVESQRERPAGSTARASAHRTSSGASPAPASAPPSLTGSPSSPPPAAPAPSSPPPASSPPSPSPASPPSSPPASEPPSGGSPPPSSSCEGTVSCALDTVGETVGGVGGLLNR